MLRYASALFHDPTTRLTSVSDIFEKLTPPRETHHLAATFKALLFFLRHALRQHFGPENRTYRWQGDSDFINSVSPSL